MKACIICGRYFIPKSPRAIVCSEDCRRIRDRETSRDYKRRKKLEEAEKKRQMEANEVRKGKSNSEAIDDLRAASKKEGLSYGYYVAKYGL